MDLTQQTQVDARPGSYFFPHPTKTRDLASHKSAQKENGATLLNHCSVLSEEF